MVGLPVMMSFGKASVTDSLDDSANAENQNTPDLPIFGPFPPTDDEYPEDEIKKAEEFKN